MEGTEYPPDETFEVSDSTASVYATPENEGANVCRVATLSPMLGGDGGALAGLGEELQALGFPLALSSGEAVWHDIAWSDLLTGAAEGAGDPDERRVSAWVSLVETSDPAPALAFLVAVLGSRLERESAAAAAVLITAAPPAAAQPRRPLGPWLWDLWQDVYDSTGRDWPDVLSWIRLDWPYGWRDGDPQADDLAVWEPDVWARIFRSAVRFAGLYDGAALIGLLARVRFAQAIRSPDPVTRSLAAAAFLPQAVGSPPPPASNDASPSATAVSTMIHGTWGWKGDWWRPQAGFHDFILSNHRPNLYGGGARFSWSGAYSDPQRALAALDFRDWAGVMAPHGIESVFAHSYGGEVAARAKLAGVPIAELVLLSAPVTDYVDQVVANPSARVVDIRLRHDPVLTIARTRQRILPPRPNVIEVILKQHRLPHAATHDERVWAKENLAARAGL